LVLVGWGGHWYFSLCSGRHPRAKQHPIFSPKVFIYLFIYYYYLF
jgi:hypothetical protein